MAYQKEGIEMAYLMKTSTRLLGAQNDFERESYLEGFISGNPLILSSSEDAPENFVSVYIIGRQEICKIYHKQRTGITDLICLIWNPDIEKYQIWVYELKVYSNNTNDVQQLLDYLEAIESPKNKDHKDDIINRAKGIVGDDFLDHNLNIRGALCAQAFSDDVIKKIIEENSSRANEEKLLAVKIYRFPVDNDVFVLVEPFIGEERTTTGGRHITFYNDIPTLSKSDLVRELTGVLSRRKNTHPQRFEQLKVLLELFIKNPDRAITQEELRTEWQKRKLPREDRGLSVSQLLGYKNSRALRQILNWDIFPPDIKDNYRLRDKKYAEILSDVLANI
ncbi:MAG TPA: hypothetical protein P5312_10810 [Bacteroidales bacterium]|nr:hypothetical protein [Bacteroidales bacterium]